MPLGFIRYFATTNDSTVGKAALAYLQSLLRIAPVRVISKSGQLEGGWRRFEQLLLTPMAGTYVSCVCTPPTQWIWEQSVPMPSGNIAFGAAGPQQAPDAPKVAGVAKGTQELYTEWAGSGPRATRLRNVLFVVEPMDTAAQHQTASRYEAVIASSLEVCVEISKRFPVRPFSAPVVYTPVSAAQHHIIREAVLGEPS